MVADLFDHLIPDAANVAVLDAGCGTGLVGERVALRKPKSLDGVDLSQTMLSRAQERAVYDSLECCELVSYMERMPEHYDVIVSAATLIHFGDLAPVFRAASVCLRPGGRMLFTVFSNEGADVTLSFENGHAEGGCYLHSRHHVETAAFEAGLTVEYREEGIHEYDRGKPVMAVCVGLLRQ
jgi:predicted TPR repeat methyltransferase